MVTQVYGRARRDNGYWTLFNPETGNKVRLTFRNDVDKPVKATAPELADIKINDYCPYGCAFCYQGSTIKGGHSRLEDIIVIADAMSAAGVFEVALGGGEPTLHPDFTEIMRAFRERGVVPNFTTKNKWWHRQHPEVLGLMGGFAYSVETARDVIQLGLALEYVPLKPGQVNLHVVMGTVDFMMMRSIMEQASHYGFRITLLGYKTTGRGGDVVPIPYDWWLDTLGWFPDVPLSIDTALAGQYQNEILRAGVPQEMFHTQEGKFSVYIDAVKMAMAPSSYDDDIDFRPFTPDGWLTAFKDF